MEQLNSILFYINAVLIIFTSIAAIFTKKIMNAVFYALICFFCFGILFFALNATFNGAVQMSIYGAALTVLFTIAIMITNYRNEQRQTIKITPRFFIIITGIIMIFSSVVIFLKETLNYEPALMMYMSSSHILTSPDNIKRLSSELLTHNMYSYELLGIYLLIVLTGIAVLAAFKGETK